LQILLLRFLRQAVDWANHVQVIVTTHSPIFASRAAAESITPIRQTGTGLVAVPINCKPASPVGMRIQQYLNATRSELFFARRLLLVEGDSELLLMNELGRHCGVDVAGAGISVVSANGLNFELFLPFVAGDALGIPVAILTDGDRKASAADPERSDDDGDDGDDDGSAYAKNLVRSVEADELVAVFVASVTFEVELGQSPANREVMLRALSGIVGSRMYANIVGALPAVEDATWPAEFYNQTFRQRRISKARFAHELATLLSCMNVGNFDVPEYISLALKHVSPDLSVAGTASPPHSDA
jgi:putative ATP-dependent endonuclease of the OLD family